ncbi:MAG: M28 family peptidase [Planctomycetota bacterium]
MQTPKRHAFPASRLVGSSAAVLIAGAALAALGRASDPEPALASVATQAAPAAPAVAPPAADAGAALERALATVSVEEMKSDLYFIASDEMRGRDTPSPEQRIVARFIRARLQRLGFTPGGRDGGFLYEYKWPQQGLDVANTGATLTIGGATQKLEWAQDYFLAQGAYGKRTVAGHLVWGGTLEDRALEELDLAGAIVVIQPLERMPSTRRIQALEKAGAVGVAVLPFGDVEKQYSDLARRNNWYRGQRLTNGTVKDDASFPVMHLAPKIAAEVGKLVPKEAQLGERLPATMTESCDFGRRDDAVLENVCGFWPGSDPVLKNEVILLSAHYDHVGVRGTDGEVFNGADDNGSGTTGLLAIAEALKAYGPMRRSVMLIWVSGEEKGLYGSKAWTEDPSLPEGTRPLCNVNIDMIGRNASDQLLITPTKDHPSYSLLTKTAERNAAAEGFTTLGSADAYWRRSDHMNFADNLGIPVAFLFADVHEDYHKVTDTPDKINYDKAARVVRLVLRMLQDLQIDAPKF